MLTSKLCSAFSLFAILGLAVGSAAAADSDGDTIDDGVDQFPCDASLSTTVYVPAQGAFGSVLYEDNWPALGDLDFNDGVVAYQYALGYEGPPANNNLRMLTLSFNVLAAGAGLPSGLALSLPIPKANIQSVTLQSAGGAPQSLTVRAADTNAVIDLLDNTKDNFENLGPFVNTEPSIPAQTETQYKLTVSLSSAVQVNPADAPFDLFFFYTDDPSREIHRPMYEGTAGMNQALFNTEADGSTASRHFVDKDGLPFVLDVPKVPQWAQEQVSVDVAYPQVVGFASSSGSQNQTWYDAPVAMHIFAVGAGGGTMPVASFIPGENGYLPGWADDSCFSCSDGVQNGYEEGVDCGGTCSTSCVPDGSSPLSAGVTCLSILAGNPGSPDGVYYIDPDGQGAFQVYCDMTTPGYTNTPGWMRFAYKPNTDDCPEKADLMPNSCIQSYSRFERMLAVSAHKVRSQCGSFAHDGPNNFPYASTGIPAEGRYTGGYCTNGAWFLGNHDCVQNGSTTWSGSPAWIWILKPDIKACGYAGAAGYQGYAYLQ